MKGDYCLTVLFPFTFEIKKYKDGQVGAQCHQIPGIIMQCDSEEHLKAEAPILINDWFEVSRQVDKKRYAKKKD